MNKRQNLERIKGKFAYKLPGLDSFVAEVVNDLGDKYPDIDLIDIGWQFDVEFKHQLARRIARESAETTS